MNNKSINKTKIIKNPGISAVEFFEKLSGKEKNVCFLHTASGNGKSILAWGPVSKFVYKMAGFKRRNSKNFEQIFENFIIQNTKKRRKLIGYFSYDLSYQLYDVKRHAKDDLKLPDVHFFAFDNWVVFENRKIKVFYKDAKFLAKVYEILKRKNREDKGGKINKAGFKMTISKEQYKKAYEKIENYIKAGDIYQINLTQRLEASTSQKPRELFAKIIKTNPVEFAAYVEGDGFEILSASPERFIKIENRKIETCPIKGTRPRGRTAKEDEKFRKELLKSEKDAAELDMITDLLRNDLGKVCKIGSVKVAGNRLISKCPTVWHTYSKIVGELDDGVTPIRALISMLPGGSITGCPKKRAIEIIDELEPKTRGIYTGVIGYVDPNFDLDFNIAIRTVIKKGGKFYLQVGGGIVYDSTEKAEYEETLLKAGSFLGILK